MRGVVWAALLRRRGGHPKEQKRFCGWFCWNVEGGFVRLPALPPQNIDHRY